MDQITTTLIAYSECEPTGKRIATFLVRVPKFIQAHLNSHRALSKNSASSRAIPAYKVRRQVLRDPFIPVHFGENRAGMVSGAPLAGMRLSVARSVWLYARFITCSFHWIGERAGVHKEVLNRLLEPWMMTEVIITGTEWRNFIALRTGNTAQPEIQVVARQIAQVLERSAPHMLAAGEWHLPFLNEGERAFDLDTKKKVSAARCARVSYLLFDGKTSTITSDIRLCEKLSSSGHWSPFEHQAQALANLERTGNFIGWRQYRKEFPHEHGGDFA
jgi:thymidylate synthase ThyX